MYVNKIQKENKQLRKLKRINQIKKNIKTKHGITVVKYTAYSVDVAMSTEPVSRRFRDPLPL